jgi:hypothetical protein
MVILPLAYLLRSPQMVLNWGDLETAERIKGASDELLEDINSKTSLKFIIILPYMGGI